VMVPPTTDRWLMMTEKERHEYILARLNSGSLEIVYARPNADLFYVTLRPPKEMPKHDYGAQATVVEQGPPE
jgi:hypothetical protein